MSTEEFTPFLVGETEGEQPKPQAGFIWVDEDEPAAKPAAPKRRTSSRSRKRVEPLEFDDSKAVIAIGIAAADKAAEFLSPTWAKVPRLTGGDAILANYLDALTSSDQPEVDRLASALAEAYGENEWLAKLFRSAQKYGRKSAPFIKLALACSAIFIPRLLALGLIPNPFAAPEGGNDGTDVESGRAHGDRGYDGFGEIGADGVPSGSVSQAVHSAEIESGQREVPASTNGYQSSTDFASTSRPMGTAPPFHGGA